MRRLALAVMVFCAGPLSAEVHSMSRDDIRQLLLQHRMGHTQRGRFFGEEFHFQDGTVIWRYGGSGECLYGQWWFDMGDVCYRYEGVKTPNCVTYFWREGALFARDRPVPGNEGDESRVDLRDRAPPACAGG